MPRLENWGVVPADNDPFKAPEQRRSMLIGDVYDHTNPRFHDGSRITTSFISHKGELPDSCATAGGTTYILGEPDPGYERLYPNAKERFFATLAAVAPGV